MSQPLDYATPSAVKPRKVRPWLLGWLLFLVVALLIFASLHQAPLSHGAIPLSFVYAQIKAGNVANISIDGDTLEGQLRTPALIGSGSVTHFRVELPAGTSANWTFTQWLLEHSPNATVNVETSNNFVSNILMPIIPWALILTFVWLFVVRPLRKKNAHPARPMPVVIVKQEGG